MVLQDGTFDAERLVYLPNGMMDQMMRFLGDEILVNGRPDAAFPAASRSYRLRLLNGSNARIHKLGWDENNEDKLAQRGIYPAEFERLWANSPRYEKNRSSGPAAWKMIGRDAGGRTLCIGIL